MSFVDPFGRVQDELRISVTDRCNLRCAYCMPEEPTWFPRRELLDFEETARLARIVARRGVRRFRLTGGEPLLRRDLPRLVRLLSTTPGVQELSLTTNGLLLDPQALPLAEAGLQRVNVSLDTLDPARFFEMTRCDGLERVLRGLEAAESAGLAPLKINTVLLRGMNDDEIIPMAATARERGWELRFIEFMPLANGGTWDVSRIVPGDEVRRRVNEHWSLEPDPEQDPTAPATRWVFRDGRGALGFIDSVTRPFCATCSRIRLTADGKLSTCLYATRETDLKTPLRSGADEAELEALVEQTVLRKGEGGALGILERNAAIPLTRTMHQIGG